MKKIILLTNILTPYRIYFYNILFEEFRKLNTDFKVLVTAETEPNRSWMYHQFKTKFTVLNKGKVFNFPNNVFLHINFGIKQFIRKEKPDIIISAGSYLYPALWNIITLKKEIQFQLFYWNESHDHEFRNYNKLILLIRERLRTVVFKKFDGFWYAGKWSLELIEKYANKNTRKIFVPNLIDNTKFNLVNTFTSLQRNSFLDKYKLVDKDKIILLCPARLDHDKGQIDFLNNFLKLEERKFFTILFVGDGSDYNQLKSLIQNDRYWDVRLLGYKDEEEMLKLYSISDFLLLPSNSDPNPLTCIESLWCSLPLLVSNHVGNGPEIIAHGENGYLIDMEDSSKWEVIFKDIINNISYWRSTAKALCYDLAKNNYNAISVTSRIVNQILY